MEATYERTYYDETLLVALEERVDDVINEVFQGEVEPDFIVEAMERIHDELDDLMQKWTR